MPLKTKPLNNNVLIEVKREYEGVSRSDDNESLKVGKVIDCSVSSHHITASSFGELNPDYLVIIPQLKGKTVRWEEFAEGGQTFTEDGKLYALVPWWRLISITEETE